MVEPPREALPADPVTSAPGATKPVATDDFSARLATAIADPGCEGHALLLVGLDEESVDGGKSEAEIMLPQLAEIVRPQDQLTRLSPGRYAMLLFDRDMAELSRKIAAIDFLRKYAREGLAAGERPGPTPISTTFLRRDDGVRSALDRVRQKLERFTEL